METLHSVAEHSSNLLEGIGIVAGLVFNAYVTRRDEKSRRISNLIAINQEHREIWKEVYTHPALSRITAEDVDLVSAPVTAQEEVMVNSLILHLGTVYEAMRSDLYVKTEGLEADIRDFFGLPIPKAVWEKTKKYQNLKFLRFIENAMN